MNSEELKQLARDVAELARDVAEIKMAVVGETSLGIPGLGRRVEKLESWRDNINLKTAFYSGVATVIVLLAKSAFEYIAHK